MAGSIADVVIDFFFSFDVILLAAFVSRLSGKRVSLDVSQPYGTPRPVSEVHVSLSVSRTHNEVDRWVNNWNWFGTKRSWPNRDSISKFSCTAEDSYETPQSV